MVNRDGELRVELLAMRSPMSEICFPVTGGLQRKVGRKGNKNSHVCVMIPPAFINAWKLLQQNIWQGC